MTFSISRVAGLGLCLIVTSGAAQAQLQRNPLGDNPLGIPNVQVRGLEVRDITLTSPHGATVTFGRVAFAGLNRDQETVRADTATFERISARMGDERVDIPLITMSKLTIPAELFRAFSEGGSLDRDWAGLLTQASIEETKIDSINHTDAVAKDEMRVSGLVFSNLRNGMLDSAQIAQIAGSDPAQNTRLAMGAIRYQGINFSELVRFAKGGGSGEAKPLLKLATAERMEVASPDATVRMARLEMADVVGRAPAQGFPVPSVATAALAGDAENAKAAARYAQEVLRYLRVGRYALQGLEVTSPDGNFKMGEVSVAGLSARGIDRFLITGVDVASPTGPAKLSRFEIERISYGALVDMGLNAAATGTDPDFAPSAILDYAPRIGAIRLNGLDLSTPVGPFALGEFRIEMDDRAGSVPEKLLIALTGLKLNLSKLDGNSGAEKLVALGYDEIAANSQLQVRFASGERALIIDQTGVLVEKVGQLELDGRFAGVDLMAAAKQPERAEQLVNAARFESATLRVRNLGFAERFFAEIAKTAGLSPDAIRAGIAAQVKAQATAMLGPALVAGSGEALESFVRSSGRLVVQAAPRGNQPLTLGEMQAMAPPQLLNRLSIKVEVPRD